MLLISQNIGNYDLKLPKNTILRINLAWCNSLKELEVKSDIEYLIDDLN